MAKTEIALIIVFFALIAGCSKSNDGSASPDNSARNVAISEISPLRAKIGDTIKVIGTGLNEVNQIILKYEDSIYSEDKKELGNFLSHTDTEIIFVVPEMNHQKVKMNFPNNIRYDLELIGLIPIKENFRSISGVQLLDNKVGFIEADGKLYKSVDGFYKWSLQTNFIEKSIACFYFLDENNGWIATTENGVPKIYATTDGGHTTTLKYDFSLGFDTPRKIQLSSMDEGYFVDSDSNLYKCSGESVTNIYDAYPSLSALPFGKIEIFSFNLINDNLIFIGPNDTSALIKIDNGQTSFSDFDSWPSPPNFHGTIGYLNLDTKIYKSNDLGDSWELIKDFEVATTLPYFLNELDGIAVMKTYRNQLFQTSDGGETWSFYYEFSPDHGVSYNDFSSESGLLGSPNGKLWKYVKE